MAVHSKKKRQRKASHDPISLQRLVRQVVEPTDALTAKEICGRLKKVGTTATQAAVLEAAKALVSSNELYSAPVNGTKQSTLFIAEPALIYLVRRLETTVRRQRDWTLGAIKKTMPVALHSLVDEAIGSLVRRRILHDVKIGAAKRKYSTQKPRPSLMLNAKRKQALDKLVASVNRWRDQPLKLSDLLEFLDGQVARGLVRVEKRAEPISLALLLKLYGEDLPLQGGLRAVPVPSTWQRYVRHVQSCNQQPDHAAFQRMMLEAKRAGRIEMRPHEWPSLLSDPERQHSIIDEAGRLLYYWLPVEDQSWTNSAT